MKILVYQDYVQNNGVLLKSLSNMGHSVSYIDAPGILAGDLAKLNPDLFIIPGGADLYYCEKLNGEGNHLIRSWVERGGNILGICAGAYYCCDALLWDAEAAIQRIDGARELAFVPATAIGPVKEFIQDGDINKSWVKLVRLDLKGALAGLSPYSLYEGGPYFEVKDTTSCEVLATYSELAEQPPAILSCQIGKGLCIASAVHIEFTDALYNAARYTTLGAQPLHEATIAQDMHNKNFGKADVFSRVLEIFRNRISA